METYHAISQIAPAGGPTDQPAEPVERTLAPTAVPDPEPAEPAAEAVNHTL